MCESRSIVYLNCNLYNLWPNRHFYIIIKFCNWLLVSKIFLLHKQRYYIKKIITSFVIASLDKTLSSFMEPWCSRRLGKRSKGLIFCGYFISIFVLGYQLINLIVQHFRCLLCLEQVLIRFMDAWLK